MCGSKMKLLMQAGVNEALTTPLTQCLCSQIQAHPCDGLLGSGASFEDVADILGNSSDIVRKHYAKWSPARQSCIDDLMERVHSGSDWSHPPKEHIQ